MEFCLGRVAHWYDGSETCGCDAELLAGDGDEPLFGTVGTNDHDVGGVE